jgi:hypothetical protein
MGHAVWSKKDPFPSYFAHFFDRNGCLLWPVKMGVVWQKKAISLS